MVALAAKEDPFEAVSGHAGAASGQTDRGRRRVSSSSSTARHLGGLRPPVPGVPDAGHAAQRAAPHLDVLVRI